MILHNIKHAIRNFRANKLIFTGSILTAVLCALSISLLYSYIDNEISMDDFHKNKKNIYFFTEQRAKTTRPALTSPRSYISFNYKKYPGIKGLTNLSKYNKGDIQIKLDNKAYFIEAIATDKTFLQIFDFPVLSKSKDVLLESSNSIVITEQLAHKLFGKENPLGKSLEISVSRNTREFFIEGIVATPGSNSSMRFDILFPNPMVYNYWGTGRMGGEAILVGKGFDRKNFEKDLEEIGKKGTKHFKYSKLSIIPFEEIYFNSPNLEVENIFSVKGDKNNLKILWGIITIIFLISVFNFANLQVVNINASFKSIGINKLFGASLFNVFAQKITELFLMILIATVLILPLFQLALPWANKLLGVELTPSLVRIFILNFGILTLLFISAMIYPFIIFLKVSVVNSLKRQVFSKGKLSGAKLLITAQFSLAIFLLIASFVVVKQLNMMLNKDIGFTTENIVKTKLMYFDEIKGEKNLRKRIFDKYNFIIDELRKHSAIASFTQGYSPINPFDFSWKINGSDEDYITANTLVVEPQYLNVFNLKLKQGRFFDKEKDYNERGCMKVVVNEAAMKYWNINSIEDTRLKNSSWDVEGGNEIIGVVENFNNESLKTQIHPLAMLYITHMDSDFFIKFHKGREQEGLLFLKELYNKLNPLYTFDYTFVSDDVAALYDREKRLSQIYVVFTFIAFFLSVISLFTIALYDTRKRTKEVGIRKVNGSTIKEVMLLLNKDFLKWVIIAFVIAIPVAYYAMHKWLENFAYKTELSWWIFALAGLFTLVIALLTVMWQSYRAASKNPVEALRYE